LCHQIALEWLWQRRNRTNSWRRWQGGIIGVIYLPSPTIIFPVDGGYDSGVHVRTHCGGYPKSKAVRNSTSYYKCG
jgi:hypothetical protein